MSRAVTSQMLTVGKITGCYGVKGWVKIHAYTEPPENFLQLGQWHLKRRDGLEALAIDNGKRHGNVDNDTGHRHDRSS